MTLHLFLRTWIQLKIDFNFKNVLGPYYHFLKKLWRQICPKWIGKRNRFFETCVFILQPSKDMYFQVLKITCPSVHIIDKNIFPIHPPPMIFFLTAVTTTKTIYPSCFLRPRDISCFFSPYFFWYRVPLIHTKQTPGCYHHCRYF